LTGELSLEDESYAMANLSLRMTGLSGDVFVSPRMAGHDVLIKVSLAPGKNTLPVNCAVVGRAASGREHHIADPTMRRMAGRGHPGRFRRVAGGPRVAVDYQPGIAQRDSASCICRKSAGGFFQ
jgi:hypothetical protein